MQGIPPLESAQSGPEPEWFGARECLNHSVTMAYLQGVAINADLNYETAMMEA